MKASDMAALLMTGVSQAIRDHTGSDPTRDTIVAIGNLLAASALRSLDLPDTALPDKTPMQTRVNASMIALTLAQSLWEIWRDGPDDTGKEAYLAALQAYNDTRVAMGREPLPDPMPRPADPDMCRDDVDTISLPDPTGSGLNAVDTYRRRTRRPRRGRPAAGTAEGMDADARIEAEGDIAAEGTPPGEWVDPVSDADAVRRAQADEDQEIAEGPDRSDEDM